MTLKLSEIIVLYVLVSLSEQFGKAERQTTGDEIYGRKEHLLHSDKITLYFSILEWGSSLRGIKMMSTGLL